MKLLPWATAAVLVAAGTALAYVINNKTLLLHPADAPAEISGTVSTDKVKLLRTPDGTLFAIYGEAQDVPRLAYDTKSKVIRKPFDIVVRVSIDNGDTWGPSLNISNTASLTSALGILEGTGAPALGPDGHPDIANDPRATDYPGDSDKANVFNVGNNIIVTWGGTYCPGGAQRFVVYPELNGITVPYSCMYVSRLRWNSTTHAFDTVWPGGLPYLTERLSNGLRDVKQDANRGNSSAFVINWQEDPMGLKLGDADGPGDGASGANVNNGTDIWYASLPTATFATSSWATATRITRNASDLGPLSSAGDKATHPPGDYDRGNVGASRANIGQIGTNVIIAYEETKGSQGFVIGKYIRYHTFVWNLPPVGGEVGCIISEPHENARRVRFLTQEATNDVPRVFFYKQGEYDQGGPSDIFLRRTTGGQITPESLSPPVDAVNCRSSVVTGGNPQIDITQPAALNFSGSDALKGGTGTAPGALSGDNPIENALAHRGVIRGNTIIVGYSYTPDLFRFQYLDDTDPYNFFIRRSTDGGLTWSEAVNMTPEITGPSRLTVKEPRIVGTPPTVAGGLPGNTQNPNVIYVGYGLQTNAREPIEVPRDVDIYMMVSLDEGLSWTRAKALSAGDVQGGYNDSLEDFETQIKVRPDGLEGHVVWSTNDGTVAAASYRRIDVVDLPPEPIFANGFEGD
ncbi:MAG: exo-alpha-sialidase [Rhodanobacteraceae bacterium]|nr:exo-alpha-sialidase [Rhodanobacteraceae bacterium]